MPLYHRTITVFAGWKRHNLTRQEPTVKRQQPTVKMKRPARARSGSNDGAGSTSKHSTRPLAESVALLERLCEEKPTRVAKAISILCKGDHRLCDTVIAKTLQLGSSTSKWGTETVVKSVCTWLATLSTASIDEMVQTGNRRTDPFADPFLSSFKARPHPDVQPQQWVQDSVTRGCPRVCKRVVQKRYSMWFYRVRTALTAQAFRTLQRGDVLLAVPKPCKIWRKTVGFTGLRRWRSGHLLQHNGVFLCALAPAPGCGPSPAVLGGMGASTDWLCSIQCAHEGDCIELPPGMTTSTLEMNFTLTLERETETPVKRFHGPVPIDPVMQEWFERVSILPVWWWRSIRNQMLAGLRSVFPRELINLCYTYVYDCETLLNSQRGLAVCHSGASLRGDERDEKLAPVRDLPPNVLGFLPAASKAEVDSHPALSSDVATYECALRERILSWFPNTGKSNCWRRLVEWDTPDGVARLVNYLLTHVDLPEHGTEGGAS